MLAVDFTGGGWPVLGIEPFPQGFLNEVLPVGKGL